MTDYLFNTLYVFMLKHRGKTIQTMTDHKYQCHMYVIVTIKVNLPLVMKEVITDVDIL